ncbi:Signal peptide, CUB and EGF-like domain-containing protein 3 [Stylophora pistillata]|uniref:Signal peptide, CUB and EGF-like domain-containing protein 3 n=2 Tax=Stylophora pistillata TaxID=50429 RepID=A0A2B4RL98_STYPI|nr:Signal peptide, CUB and EGF-like domain-containing protein 3 [Stylophora pistillata]
MSTVTASSQLSPQYSPAHAALSSKTAWCPKQNFTDKEYLQVDFGERKVVRKIQIAGEANPPVNETARHVTKYLIQVSSDGGTYEDFDAVSKPMAEMEIRTQYIRLKPLEFHNFPCMRLEIYGCKAKDPELCSESNGGCSQICEQRSKYCLFGKCYFNCNIDFLCTRWVECKCQPGYKLLADGKNCADVNECDTNNGNCDQICENSKGSYQCKCRSGFLIDSDKHKCNDINECNNNNGGCNQLCRNNVGSYHCECTVGFELSEDNHTCVDIDECQVNSGGCSYGCQNLQGRYICTCPIGFELDRSQKNCKDSKECLLANGGCETNCHNNNGSYYCSCNYGFELYDNYRCRDIDECSRNIDQCNDTSTSCRNYQGRYECPCKSGFKYKQGDSYNCDYITCPALLESMGTSVSPKSQCLVVGGRKVNETCKFSCSDGYELPDPNKDTLTCIETGSWDAPIINCQRVTCPALPPIGNGELLPSICPISGNSFGSSCVYSCDSGYRLTGVGTKTCQANGQWDDQTTPSCNKDYPKPWITCPADIVAVLAPNTKEHNITGLLGQPQSNVKDIQMFPEKYRSSMLFPSGSTMLTYVASNEIGETANCTTVVTIQDQQKPTITYCTEDVYVAVSGSEAPITWPEPSFTDNVGVVKVTSTKKPGDTFQIGSYTVLYEAFDAAGNKEGCSFVVKLTRKKCEEPNEQPDNGKLDCKTFGDYIYCSVICNADKQLFKYTFGSSCNPSSLIWTPQEVVIDCVDFVTMPSNTSCPSQTIPQPSLIGVKNPLQPCVKCPRGMKYEGSQKDCIPCSIGYTSKQESSLSCIKCPEKKSTRKEGSKTCEDLCDKGKSSGDGFDSPDKHTCHLCNIGFYQDQYGATQCKQCPNGLTTISKGSTSLGDCGVTATISSFGPPTMIVDVAENGKVEFQCMASGTPEPTFVVKKTNPVPDGFGGSVSVEDIKSGDAVTGVRYIILSATEHDAGLYFCTATNKFGSDTKQLTLNVQISGGSGLGV